VPGGGDLRERVTFQRRATVDDGYGNEVAGPWVDQFTVAALVASAPGREEVLAQRLQGVRPIEITVRRSSQTAQVQPDWRAVNARNTTEIYNIRDVRDPTGQRAWLILTCTLGAAT